MHKIISIDAKIDEQLNILRKEYADESTGKLAPYGKVITMCIKESGHWKSKKQLEKLKQVQ